MTRGRRSSIALIDEGDMTSWQDDRIETRDNHGTGCTLASAIAVLLAQGCALPEAVDRSRRFVRLALRDAPRIGGGHGPMGQGVVRLDVGDAMRLNQMAVGLEDYRASVDFYRALGLRLIVDNPPDYARFEAPGGATLSIHRDPNHATPGGATIYFECNDVDAEAARLNRLGLRFDHGPIDQPWMWREARLRDPFGNVICLYRAGEMRRYPPGGRHDRRRRRSRARAARRSGGRGGGRAVPRRHCRARRQQEADRGAPRRAVRGDHHAAAPSGVGMASVEEIDPLNILWATMLAMTRAVEALGCEPARSAGRRQSLPALALPSRAIVGGDASRTLYLGRVDHRQGHARPDDARMPTRRIPAMAGPRTRAMARPRISMR